VSIEETDLRLEQYFKMLVEMLRRHDERFDKVQAEQSNVDARIAALLEAQIGREESFNRLEALIERHTKEGHNNQS
jgi:uncharacterized protein YdcH (DUF465 family)